MNIFLSLVSGLIFGVGLIVAGMANPAKVLAFLDLAGAWDPSLLLVMAGGITVAGIAFALARDRSISLLGLPLHLPSARQLDRRLLGGSLLFGVGWGLAGICPGPALILLGAGRSEGVIFVAAMVTGMLMVDQLDKLKTRASTKSWR